MCSLVNDAGVMTGVVLRLFIVRYLVKKIRVKCPINITNNLEHKLGHYSPPLPHSGFKSRQDKLRISLIQFNPTFCSNNLHFVFLARRRIDK